MPCDGIRGVAAVVTLGFLVSCSSQPQAQFLMPSPKMYVDGQVHPFDHLPAEKRTVEIETFFATNRQPEGDHYGGNLDEHLRFGTARLRLGEAGETWRGLVEASTTSPRPEPIPVELLASEEVGADHDGGSIQWARAIDRDLRKTPTRDIVIYVHGAKVGFLHSCAFAAELKHFGGRDLTSVAFDWPTHQEIFSYLSGVDVDHGRRSSERLAETIQLLSSRTRARRIHVVAWSAGARVVSRALEQLGEGSPKTVGDRYRLGSVIFAAGDVPKTDFVARIPAMHALCERVVVYMSDNDFALKWSPRLMGQGKRLGLEWDALSVEEQAFLGEHPKLELVDASYGKELRGFDISGHRYWFQHPWVNSDVFLLIRTDRSAARRGLSRSEVPGLFYFDKDYGEKIGGVAKRLTGGTW